MQATRTGRWGGVYVLKRNKRTGKMYRQYIGTKRRARSQPLRKRRISKRRRPKRRTKSRRKSRKVTRKPWWETGPTVAQIPTVVDANTAVPTLLKLDKALKREDKKDQIKFEKGLHRAGQILTGASAPPGGFPRPSAPRLSELEQKGIPPLEFDPKQRVQEIQQARIKQARLARFATRAVAREAARQTAQQALVGRGVARLQEFDRQREARQMEEVRQRQHAIEVERKLQKQRDDLAAMRQRQAERESFRPGIFG